MPPWLTEAEPQILKFNRDGKAKPFRTSGGTAAYPIKVQFANDDSARVDRPKACGFSPMIAAANQRGT